MSQRIVWRVERMQTARHTSREDWALSFIREQLDPIAEELGIAPAQVRVGFGQTQGGKNVIGECWYRGMVQDGVNEITIKVGMSGDPARVLDIVAHEYAHALTEGDGHKGRFPEVARAFGLTGRMTATVASVEFKVLTSIVLAQDPNTVTGDMPAAGWNAGIGVGLPKAGPGMPIPPTGPMDRPKKQGTRMIRCECQDCGMLFRTTRKFIERVGTCPDPDCGGVEILIG